MDPAKHQAQMAAFAETMKTGDLFNDMRVKAAQTAYMQNADLYANLKRNAPLASGEIEKDLAARRETSKQIWSKVGQRRTTRCAALATRCVRLRIVSARVRRWSVAAFKPSPTAHRKRRQPLSALRAQRLHFVAQRHFGALAGGAIDIARGTLVARDGRSAVGRTSGARGAAGLF